MVDQPVIELPNAAAHPTRQMLIVACLANRVKGGDGWELTIEDANTGVTLAYDTGGKFTHGYSRKVTLAVALPEECKLVHDYIYDQHGMPYEQYLDYIHSMATPVAPVSASDSKPDAGVIQPGTVLYRRNGAKEQRFEEVVVNTVGRTYFTLVGQSRGRYRLSDLCFDSAYSNAREQLYRTGEEILDLIERTQLEETIRKIAYYENGYQKLSLEQLRIVAGFLEKANRK